MSKRKRTKEQIRIYKTLHRKLKIEQHESTYPEVREGLTALAPHVVPAVLLLNGTNII